MDVKDSFNKKTQFIKIDKTGEFCYLEFFPKTFPTSRWSEEQKDSDPRFYTVIRVSEMKNYGGVPETCRLVNRDLLLEGENQFESPTYLKRSEFIGLGTTNLPNRIFWSF